MEFGLGYKSGKLSLKRGFAMKKVIGAALAACMLAAPVAAQDALEAARALNVCDVAGAEFLADGRLKVNCRQGTVNPQYASGVAQPAVLAGTGLGAGAAANDGRGDARASSCRKSKKKKKSVTFLSLFVCMQ